MALTPFSRSWILSPLRLPESGDSGAKLGRLTRMEFLDFDKPLTHILRCEWPIWRFGPKFGVSWLTQHRGPMTDCY